MTLNPRSVKLIAHFWMGLQLWASFEFGKAGQKVGFSPEKSPSFE